MKHVISSATIICILFVLPGCSGQDDDPCGNGIGNGYEIISGPSGPTEVDRDEVFNSLEVDPLDPDIVIVGTERNGMFRSIDGGATWQWVRRGLKHTEHGYPEFYDMLISPAGSDVAVFMISIKVQMLAAHLSYW
jgi:hypothetical protein